MPRQCKWCPDKHSSFYCRFKKNKPIKRRGKHYDKWQATKEKWYELNKSSYYFCYICNKRMTRTQLTLDHVKPRSGNPELRYELDNLEACCWTCNSLKGSMSLEAFKEKFKTLDNNISGML